MYGDLFYTTDYAIFGHEVKATEKSPQGNLTRWFITLSKGFKRKDIKQTSRSVKAYAYLFLTSQVQTRSSIADNSAHAVAAQKLFKSTFKALINQDYSIAIDIESYQGMLEHALSKVDLSVGIGIYMLPSNLNLNVGRTKGYKNKILVSNTDMKIGSNRDINRDHKKLTLRDVPKKNSDPIGSTRPTSQFKNPYRKAQLWKTSHYNFDFRDWTDCLSFLVESKWYHCYLQSVVLW